MGYCGADYERLLDRVRAADNAFLEWCRANPKDVAAAPGEDKAYADAERFGLDIGDVE